MSVKMLGLASVSLFGLLAADVWFFGGSRPYRLIFAIPAVVLFFSAIALERIEQGKKAREEVAKAKNSYDDALTYLERHPDEPKARLACLELGRIYYSLVMPDTHTVHYRNGCPVGTSDHQDNTTGREASINADIEARVGHLRAKKAA